MKSKNSFLEDCVVIFGASYCDLSTDCDFAAVPFPFFKSNFPKITRQNFKRVEKINEIKSTSNLIKKKLPI